MVFNLVVQMVIWATNFCEMQQIKGPINMVEVLKTDADLS